MKYYAGLDVSTHETAVCVVDAEGAVLAEKKVATDPDDIAAFLASAGVDFERVGLESGPCSPWLYQALIACDVPAVCLRCASAPGTPAPP